ncbi:hypothetical protein LV84_00878 [Algoriphagus ratkowskyi]|uniref:Uncharacterized protein n=1 Tax=Algoriphagus ratkowskyi TaxID=57028 RepID=A0A2W7RYK7_9BACT|nr:hypothetical protein LV84_00878 [Algoriphagus ratkowskyi]
MNWVIEKGISKEMDQSNFMRRYRAAHGAKISVPSAVKNNVIKKSPELLQGLW